MANLATINNNLLADSGIDPLSVVLGSGTANQIAYWIDADNIGALTTATYPSLTELSYVKGVTSAIQTQIDAKLSLSGGTMTGQIVLKESTDSTDYTKGLRFPNDPYGGGADISGLRLYRDGAGTEKMVLELYVGDNVSGSSQDRINFRTGAGGPSADNDLVTINGNKIWNAGNLPSPQSAITLTTTGTSGAATFVSNTLNIPQYQAALTNPVTGTGTTNYVAKFTGTSSVGNSSIFDNGTFVGIGITSSFAGGPKLYVNKTTASEEIFRVDGQSGAGVIVASNTASGTQTTFTGNIGVGVTPSAWNLGGTPVIQMGSGVHFFGAGIQAQMGSNAYFNGVDYIYVTTNPASRYTQNSGIHSWQIATSGNANDAISFTEAMRVDNSANVIIGDINPTARLTVVRGTSGNVASFTSGVSTINSYSGITLNAYTSGGAAWYGSEIRSINTVGSPSALNPRLGFFTQNEGTWLPADRTEKLSILANGNVLINTQTDYGHKLSIVGDVFLAGAYSIKSATEGVVFLKHTTAEYNFWVFQEASAGWGMFTINDNTELNTIGGIMTGSGLGTYFTAAGGTGTDLSTITGAGAGVKGNIGFAHDSGNAFFNGSVGVGTASPSFKLDVNGTVRIVNTLRIDGFDTVSAQRAIGFGGNTLGTNPVIYSDGNYLAISSKTNQALYLNGDSNGAIFMNGTGKVAIGSTGIYGGGNAKESTLLVVGTPPSDDVDRGLISFMDNRAYDVSGVGGRVMMGGKYNSSGDITFFAGIAGVKENTTDGNYAGALALYSRPNGAGALERIRIASNGAVRFNAYGSGTFTGTRAYDLSVDASGNIIEVAIGAGTVTGTGTANYIPKWTSTSAIGNSIIYDDGTKIGIATATPNAILEIAAGSSNNFVSISGNRNGNLSSTYGLRLTETHRSTGANGIDHYAVYITPTFDTNSSNLGTVYGAYIAPIETGVYDIGTAYGLYVSAMTVSTGTVTSNYAAAFMNGRVGIGTATPAELLQVVGTGLFEGLSVTKTNVNVYPSVTRTSTSYEAGWKYRTASADSWYIGLRSADGTGSYHFYSYTTNTSVAQITASGELLIGRTTDAGDYILQTGGSAYFSKSDPTNGTIVRANIGDNTTISATNIAKFSLSEGDNEVGYFQAARDGTATNKLMSTATGYSLQIGTTGAGSLTFFTNNTRKMLLNSSGNLGLGTIPSAWSLGTTLQIGGDNSAINFSGTSAILSIINAYYNGSAYIVQNTAESASFEYGLARGAAFNWRMSASQTVGGTVTLPIVMSLSTAGNLSIGNTNDTYRLDVTGNIRSTETVLVGNGTAQTELKIDSLGGADKGPFIRFLKAGSAKAYVGAYSAIVSGTSDDLTFYATGSQQWMTNNSTTTKMFLSTLGNLGLSSTPSNAYTDAVTIEMGSSAIFWTEKTASIYNSLSSGLNYYYNAAGNPLYKNTGITSSRYVQYQGTHSWDTAPSGTAGNAITFTTRMYLNSSGDLMIGILESTGRLTVLRGSSGNVATFTSGDTAANSYSGITINSTIVSGVAWYGSEIRNVNTGGNPNFLNPRLGFFTQNTSTYLPADRTEKMSIFGSGNVAINTTTDSGYKLNVNGTVRIANTLQIDGYDTVSAQRAIGFGGNTLGTNPVIYSNGSYLAINSKTAEILYLNDSVNSTVAIATGGGNLGIGTTTTAGIVEISRTNVNVYPRVNRSSTSYECGWKYSTGGTDSWYIGMRSADGTGSYHFYSYTTNTSVAQITAGGDFLIGYTGDQGAYLLQVNGAVLASSFFEASDVRLKNIFNKHQSNDFGAIEYKWNDNRDEKLHWGYSAQEVMKWLPDAVNENEDGYLTLDYNQAHTYKIAMLEKRIAELEQQLKNK